MKIGINALYLIPGRVGGSEIYLRRLIEGLARIDRENEYIIFTNRENRGSFRLGDNFSEHHCPVRAIIRPHRIAWEQLVLPYRARQHRLDLLHSPGFVAPLYSPCPSVVTVLDLIYLEFPETFPFLARQWMRFLVKHSARRAASLIVLSEYSRGEVMWNLDIAARKVNVVYLGGGEDEPETIPEASAKELLHGQGIICPYILTVSAAHPHKNLARMIQAYYQFRKSNPDNQLVIVGVKHGRHFARLRELVQRLQITDSVIFTGWIPDRTKEAIYSRARLLVYPSLLEGFGLPILEAMRHGCPVACSDVPSLKEVAGEAAVFFNPYSIGDISRVIARCLNDDNFREEMIGEGKRQSANFRWEETARRTLAVYRKTMGLKYSNQ